MYTGIVAGLGTIKSVESRPGLARFAVSVPAGFSDSLERGASVAVDGVCLTTLEFDQESIAFEAMGETLRLTTLGDLAEGRRVNLERSARSGDEVGGHDISGHVDGTATIVAVERPEGNHVVTFSVTSELMRFVFSKGFVALDGASLTVVDANEDQCTFKVWFISETLAVTTFGFKGVGDTVNFEAHPATRVQVEVAERMARRANSK